MLVHWRLVMLDCYRVNFVLSQNYSKSMCPTPNYGLSNSGSHLNPSKAEVQVAVNPLVSEASHSNQFLFLLTALSRWLFTHLILSFDTHC